MGEQIQRAKADAKAKKTGHVDVSIYRDALAAAGTAVDFIGYTETSAEAKIVGLIVGGAAVPAASEGEQVEFVLNRTPFYAEGGGQLADTGHRLRPHGARRGDGARRAVPAARADRAPGAP